MNKDKTFKLILGRETNILPGKVWTEYDCIISDEKMMCILITNRLNKYEIMYKDITEAKFFVSSNELWLKLIINNEDLYFTSKRKYFRSKMGRKLLYEIERYTKIKNMETYKKFVGNMFFFWIFK